jgi:CheY-like chemotaxis protein
MEQGEKIEIAPLQAAATSGPPLEILLVEDCAWDEELTLFALRRGGLANAIHVVRDGVEALDFFARSGRYAMRDGPDPGLVLLDLRLPKLSGLEVLQQLKSDPARRGVRVVGLLSTPDDENLAELHRLGVDGVLVKPPKFAEFMQLAVEFGVQSRLLHRPWPVRGTPA